MEMTYAEICRHVGHLYLEAQKQIETSGKVQSTQLKELAEELSKVKKERDDALQLLNKG